MELNDTNIKKLRQLVVFTVAAVVAGVNYRRVFSFAMTLFGFAWPFLLGAAVAFVLNVPMRRLERLVPVKNRRLRRGISLLLTLVFVAGVLLLAVFVVIPQLFQTIMSLQSSIPAFLIGLKKEAEELFARNPEIVSYINGIQIDWKAFYEEMLAFLSSGAGTVLSSTITAAVSIVSGVTTFFISFIFAIYLLLQKETLSMQFHKLMRAFLPDRLTNRILSVSKLAFDTFSHFLTGQCLEAVILGTMFFITLTVLRLPYALLIGVLIAFTALIPMFGAFIGLGIGAFLMLMVRPFDAILFIPTFFILQQIEGNLIYPHVVGNSVGLPSIWVLVAVTIGGSAMGIAGMLLFIPLCSVLYSLFRAAVYERLQKRRDQEAAAELAKKNEKNGGKGKT